MNSDTCSNNLSLGLKRPCTLKLFFDRTKLIIYNVALIFDLDSYKQQGIVSQLVK